MLKKPSRGKMQDNQAAWRSIIVHCTIERTCARQGNAHVLHGSTMREPKVLRYEQRGQHMRYIKLPDYNPVPRTGPGRFTHQQMMQCGITVCNAKSRVACLAGSTAPPRIYPVAPTDFTPLASLIGGAMIGVAAVLLMLTHGRIAGISGIAVRMLPPYFDRDALGRFCFVAGLVAAPLLLAKVTGEWPVMSASNNALLLVAAGALAGFGSVWGNGCTSGHGICGLSRLSMRSLVAVAVFMTTAIITVFIVRHVI
jgi:uncharacterized protein